MPTPTTPHAPRRITSRRHLAGALLLAVLVGSAAVGCSTSGGRSDAAPTTADAPTTTEAGDTTTTTTTEADDGPDVEGDDPFGDDDCPTADEVGEVVGAEVSRSGFSGGFTGTELSYAYSGCSYDLADDAGSFSISRITIEDGVELAGPLFEAIDAGAQEDDRTEGFEPIEGLGDDAYRTGTEVALLHGPQMVLVAHTATGDDEDGDPEAAAEGAAAVLPLDLSTTPIDCEAVAAALEPVWGASESIGISFGGLYLNDVSIDLEGCSITFADGAEADVRVGPSDQWAAWVEAERTSMFSRTYTGVTLGEHAAFDDGTQLVVDEGDDPLRVASQDPEDGPVTEDPAATRLALAELVLGA